MELTSAKERAFRSPEKDQKDQSKQMLWIPEKERGAKQPIFWQEMGAQGSVEWIYWSWSLIISNIKKYLI